MWDRADCHRSVMSRTQNAGRPVVEPGTEEKEVMHSALAKIAALASLIVASAGHAAGITGAGSTFAYPIFARWSAAYHAGGGPEVNYQSIGSGAGIAQIKAKTVDFGASDMPLTVADL